MNTATYGHSWSLRGQLRQLAATMTWSEFRQAYRPQTSPGIVSQIVVDARILIARLRSERNPRR